MRSNRMPLWAMFLLLFQTLAYGQSTELEVIDFQLRWTHQFQFAGYYAAVEKGFYAEEGLEVRIHEGSPKHQPVSEVLSGNALYAEGNSEVLFQRLSGQPLVALAVIFQHSPSVLLARSGLTSVHDLIDKKIMLMNMTEDADFLTMFKSEGVDFFNLNIVPSSYDLNDLISGKVDAFNSYLTNEPFILQQQGFEYEVIAPLNYGIDFYSDILFTTEQEVINHPERVEKMRRATIKGWQYAMAHPDEIIDLLIDQYQVKKSRQHLQFEAAEMRKLIFPDLIQIGHMNPYRWKHMADTFVKAGLVDPNYSLTGFIYDDTPKALPPWFLPAALSALAAFMVICFITFYLHRLNYRLQQTQAELLRSKQQLDEAQQMAHLGSWDWNIAESQIICSDEAKRLYAFDASKSVLDLDDFIKTLHPEDKDGVLAALDDVLSGQANYDVEYRIIQPSGEVHYIHAQGHLICDEQQRPQRMVGTSLDITERKKLELKLQYQANIDYLTEINNRRHFMELAQYELNRSRRYETPVCMLLLDIDFFKKINDTYGHHVGDQVLRHLGNIFKLCLRDSDIMGRIGGEEFAVLLPETESAEALEIAERLAEQIRNQKSGFPFQITASLGVAKWDIKTDNMDKLMEKADQALYQAKENGRNKVCVFNDVF